MTREEVIEVIKAYRDKLTNSASNQLDGDIKAFDRAIKALELESCEDAISRQAVLEYIEGSEAELGHSSENELVCQDIKELPPVNLQPKTGHWIFDEILDKHYYCSECKSMGVDYWDFCPNCGAKMVEPQEREG